MTGYGVKGCGCGRRRRIPRTVGITAFLLFLFFVYLMMY